MSFLIFLSRHNTSDFVRGTTRTLELMNEFHIVMEQREDTKTFLVRENRCKLPLDNVPQHSEKVNRESLIQDFPISPAQFLNLHSLPRLFILDELSLSFPRIGASLLRKIFCLPYITDWLFRRLPHLCILFSSRERTELL